MRIIAARFTFLASLAILLTGCYESETALLAKGEQVPLNGSFQCRHPDNEEHFDLTFSEHKDGSGPSLSYRYVDSEGHAYLLKKLPSGLFLGQTKAERSLARFQIDAEGFEYGFVEILDDNTFLVFFDDTSGKWDRIQGLLAKFKVEHKRADDLLFLRGDNRTILNFLAAHDKTMLKESTKCERRHE
jgi:hypothetical protein